MSSDIIVKMKGSVFVTYFCMIATVVAGAGCNQIGTGTVNTNATTGGSRSGGRTLPELPTLGAGSPEERVAALESYANLLSDLVVSFEDEISQASSSATATLATAQSGSGQVQNQINLVNQGIDSFPQNACLRIPGAVWNPANSTCVPLQNSFVFPGYRSIKLLYNEVSAFTCQTGGFDNPEFPSAGVCRVIPPEFQVANASGGFRINFSHATLAGQVTTSPVNRLRAFYVDSFAHSCEFIELRLKASAQVSRPGASDWGAVKFVLERLNNNGDVIPLNPITGSSGVSYFPHETMPLGTLFQPSFWGAGTDLVLGRDSRNDTNQMVSLYGARDTFLTACNSPGCRDYFRVKPVYRGAVPMGATVTILCHPRQQ